jgi:hypothetical protein
MTTDAAIACALREMALARAGRTFCPSEVARGLAAEWRPLMPRVREVAAGCPWLVATQRGALVDAVAARGPIRLSLAPDGGPRDVSAGEEAGRGA